MRTPLLSFLVTILVPIVSRAADWQPITTELLAREKTGFGGLCGVVVDHATGQIIVNLSDRGIFTSHDRGKTWERLGKEAFKGRTEDPGCFLIDPTGTTKRLLLPLVYGLPISFGNAEKGDWRTADKASVHVDWCAADWSDPDLKFLLTLKHESGGVMLRSRDGGKKFEEVGKNFGPAWVFDADTAVAAKLKTRDDPKGGLVRTTDGGKTWSDPTGFTPRAITLPRWHSKALYWLAEGALYKTTDKAATWEKLSTVKDAFFGPVFGKDAKQLFVLMNKGIIESTDGGATWSSPIAVPKGLKGVNGLAWLEYDPTADVLYVMMMSSELYALNRK
ncbi:MAG TPA: sialidase family protein [Urbifossiella sp.]|jgi:photosystem II stability/assembly factor-like uncharacterized protein